MQQQRMQQIEQQMARNMSFAYKVHAVKTKIKTKLVQAIFR